MGCLRCRPPPPSSARTTTWPSATATATTAPTADRARPTHGSPSYGIPFGSWRDRFERLTEQLEIVTGLWTTPPESTYRFDGRHYRIEDSPALPKPVQSLRPPIIVGGAGPTRTPALAARFADEFNSVFLSPAVAEAQFARVDRACEGAGRDPGRLRRSSAVTVICCGTDGAEIGRRARAIGRSVDDLRRNGACGTPDQVAERLGEWAGAGAEVLYLQVLDPTDIDHVRLIARQVAPRIEPRRAALRWGLRSQAIPCQRGP